MTTQEEVVKIGKKLENLLDKNAVEHSSGCDLLKCLKDLPITLEVLQKTHIGVTVNSFRKASKDDEAIGLAKVLIKTWKKLLPDSGGHGDQPARRCSTSSARSSSSTSTCTERRSSSQLDDSADDMSDVFRTSVRDSKTSESSDTGVECDSSVDKNDMRRDSFSDEPGLPLSPSVSLPSVEVEDTRDPTRLKCREMMAAALRTPPIVDGGCDPDIVAAEIEHFIYKEFENTDMKYKNRIRSRIANLKDTKNPKLRENILVCHISPKQFSAMTPEEMASDEMKKLREKLCLEAFNDHQMSTNSGTKSDLFKCGKCGKRDTTYNQLQTRSSDEPMTTFVLCNQCGFRWKFC